MHALFSLMLLGILSLGSPMGGVAQGPPQGAPQGRSGPPNELTRQQMLRRIQGQFQAQMARELQLDSEQQALLAEVLRDYAASRGEILPRRMQVEREIRRTLSQPGSEDEARRLIIEARTLREREAALRVQEEERLLEFLQPSQVLRLQFLRDQFGNRIRSLGGGPNGDIMFGPGRGGSPGN